MSTLTTIQHVLDTHTLNVVSFFEEVRPKTGQIKVRATAPDPQPGGLMDILNNVKSAPATSSIVAVPPAVTDAVAAQAANPSATPAPAVLDIIKNLQDISMLDTYISVAASLIMYKARPAGWDITNKDQAADFTKALTNARFQVLTQGLAGFLSVQDALSQSYTKSTTSADIHMEFLGTIFKSFGFSPAAMTQLDSIMTTITDSLKSLQLSWSDQSSTLDHLISLYYFEEVMGTDQKVPMMRLFFLHIDQHSWSLSVGKSSVSHFDFNMNYTDNKAAMSLTQMDAVNPNTKTTNREVIQGYIETMTNQSLDTIRTLTQPKAINSDSNPTS